MNRHHRLLAVVPCLLLAFSGCGERTLNTSQVEDLVTQGITKQTSAKGVKVECPEDVTMEAGNQFECQATAGGERAPVKITQKDDQGNISWELRAQ